MERKETTRLFLTAIGSAALGAAVYYYVQKYLKDQEDLKLIKLAEQQAKVQKIEEAKAS